MNFTLREAHHWLDKAVMFGRGDERLQGVNTDTRSIAAGQMYVPIRGEQFDGHQFVEQAVANGAAAYLFDGMFDGERPHDAPAIQVPDTRRALGELAKGWRHQFSLPLVAVTGSNGKTTVKDMVAAILIEAVGEDHAVATRGNLNNDIGLPQSVFTLQQCHRLAVFELGMNHPGEIAWLAEIAQPTVALVNNAQRDHQEFLDSVEETARENGLVFAHLQSDSACAIFPGDDACSDIWRAQSAAVRQIEFGFSEVAGRFDVWASAESLPEQFECHLGEQTISVSLQIDGRHNVRNALAAVACGLALQISPEAIRAGLQNFTAAAGRMRRRNEYQAGVLIDDSYNANADSVRAAIEVLADLPEPRILILGDMGEVGEEGPQVHREVGAYAQACGITTLLAAGELSRETVKAFGSAGRHYESVGALIADCGSIVRPGASVLVKGARSMKMERVVAALVPAEPVKVH